MIPEHIRAKAIEAANLSGYDNPPMTLMKDALEMSVIAALNYIESQMRNTDEETCFDDEDCDQYDENAEESHYHQYFTWLGKEPSE